MELLYNFIAALWMVYSGQTSTPPAAQAQLTPTFTLSHGKPVPNGIVNDIPASVFFDDTGKFHVTDSLSQYSPYQQDNHDHTWRFLTGKDFDGINANIGLARDNITVQNTTILCDFSPYSISHPNAKVDKTFDITTQNGIGAFNVSLQAYAPVIKAALLKKGIATVDSDFEKTDGGFKKLIDRINDQKVTNSAQLYTYLTNQNVKFKQYASGYNYNNFCTLTGLWVDPDTADYGLVHEEHFGTYPRMDAIEYARSQDHGKTWTILAPIITSPFPYYGVTSTLTGVDKTDPSLKGSYYYGDGDPRLVVDTRSGYFYMFYSARIQPGFSDHIWEFVARAPIKDKMRPDSWKKWYNGKWEEPGVGGKESNLIPITAENALGYSTKEYDPVKAGTPNQLGHVPSDLRVINVSWNAFLGKYIGTPDRSGIDAAGPDGKKPLPFYVSDDLATQRWTMAGEFADYKTRSWYRWMLDDKSKTSSQVTGKTFRSYCSHECSENSGAEYIPVTITCNAGIPCAGKEPVVSGSAYKLENQGGFGLLGFSGNKWIFEATDDGFFRIQDLYSKRYLSISDRATTAEFEKYASNGLAGPGNTGLPSSSPLLASASASDIGYGLPGPAADSTTKTSAIPENATAVSKWPSRRWGAVVSLADSATYTNIDSGATATASQDDSNRNSLAQQWYLEHVSGVGNETLYRLINRYSGLAFSFSYGFGLMAPVRDWDATSPASITVWPANNQLLRITPSN